MAHHLVSEMGLNEDSKTIRHLNMDLEGISELRETVKQIIKNPPVTGLVLLRVILIASMLNFSKETLWNSRLFVSMLFMDFHDLTSCMGSFHLKYSEVLKKYIFDDDSFQLFALSRRFIRSFSRISIVDDAIFYLMSLFQTCLRKWQTKHDCDFHRKHAFTWVSDERSFIYFIEREN